MIDKKETFTFSRALHMVRNNGQKARFVDWSDDTYICIVEGGLVLVDPHGVVTQFMIGNDSIMGSWIIF